MNTASRALFGSLLAAATVALRAEEAVPKAPPAPPPEARQIDYWIGSWEVTTPDGRIAGHNRIERILEGRALQEHWTGADNFTGTSLNVYDASAKVWRQFWIDRTGGVLQLTGGLVDGRMVLTGTTAAGDKITTERITWTPNPDETVRQLWEQSTDNHKTWSVAFDGLYRKK